MEARRVLASLIPNVSSAPPAVGEVQAGPFGTAHSGVRIALPRAGTSRENVTPCQAPEDSRAGARHHPRPDRRNCPGARSRSTEDHVEGTRA